MMRLKSLKLTDINHRKLVMKTSYLFKAMFLTSAVGLSACGGKETTNYVSVNQPPAAAVTSPDVSNVKVGVEITFDGSGSVDSGGDVATWIWDGTETQSATYSTKWTTPGLKQVTLVAVDAEGAKSEPFIVNVNVVSGSTNPDAAVTEVVITSSENSIELGQTLTLSADVAWDDDSTTHDVVWEASPANFATIKDGVLSPKEAGVVTVTATSGGKSGTKEITISNSDKLPDTFSLTKLDLVMNTQDVQKVGFIAKYDDGTEASNPAVTWVCDDSSIVSVSGESVTAKAVGSTKCTVSWLGKEATLDVTVTKVDVTVTGIEVNPSSVNLNKGGTEQLTATVSYSSGFPEDNPADVAWACLDADVATINNGLLTEVAEGSTTCSATLDEKSDSVAVTVEYIDELGPDDVVSIAATPAAVSVVEGSDEQLKATVTYNDDNATTELNPSFVKWSCEGADVTVTDAGMLKGVSASTGNVCTALVTNRTTDDLVSATVTVEVTGGVPGDIVPVDVERLGAVYTKAKTRFAIWSPDKTDVKVKINNADGTPFGDGVYTLTKTNFAEYEEDVYLVEVAGVPLYAQYQFVLDEQPVRDPYGMMVTPDQVEPANEYNIVMARTQKGPEGKEWSPIADNGYYKNREDAIIYEIHINDFTASANSGVKDELKGTFSGFVEQGTTLNKAGSIKTGIDHLLELGVTHVQLLPMYDFSTCSAKDDPGAMKLWNETTVNGEQLSWADDCYIWGYDPENYNIPEETYASVAKDDYQGRIDEVKYFVDELHKVGIRVIMDVVFNHTYMYLDDTKWGWANPGKWYNPHQMGADGPFGWYNWLDDESVLRETMFTPITNRYFFDNNEDQANNDLTGTGNTMDISLENPMVSRMMQDSMEYWLAEFNLDGFRHDLAGVYENQVFGDWGRYFNENGSKYADRNILIYGEPWTAGGYDPKGHTRVTTDRIGDQASGHVGVFNDHIRGAIRGGTNDGSCGFITCPDNSNAGALENGIKGHLGADPEQSINYVSAHDNRTIADKIHFTLDGSASDRKGDDYSKQLSMYANGIVMLSQGIPFLHAGAEIYRTKSNVLNTQEDSFRSPAAVNDIDWSWKEENASVFEYYKNMIALRKAHPMLRLTTADDIDEKVKPYTYSGNNYIVEASITGTADDSWSEMLVYFNTGSNVKISELRNNSGRPLNMSEWKIAAEKQDANVGGVNADDNFETSGSAITVLYKEK